MKILVIGSEGNIGSKLVPFLESKNDIEVFTCDIARKRRERYCMADIRNSETLELPFSSSPDIVIHLAGEVSRETSEHWANLAISTNCIGIMNVIRMCLKYNSKLLYAGTSEEYGELFNESTLVDETMRPGKQRGIYGLIKWMAEELVEYYHDRYDLNAVVIRIFMCYGPGEVPNPFRSAVSRFIGKALRNEKIEVHEGSKRSWCYYQDVIEGIYAAILFDSTFEIFNIGRNELKLTADVAKEIVRLTDSNSEMKLITIPSGIVLIKNASFLKAKQLLNWESKIPFKEGIKKTVEWNIERAKRYETDSFRN